MSLFKKFPDSVTLIMGILLVFILMTWIIPAGEFERTKNKDGREVVVPGTYQTVAASPQGPGAFFTAPIKGFISAAEIIAFVFLVGGAFSIVNKTGAVNAGLANIIRLSKRKPKYKRWVIPVLMVLFSLGGATFGMSEEVLVFILITIPLAIALGYDSIIGVAIPFVGAGVGFAGAFSNPFTIGVAQGIAEIPLFTGIEYRLVVWSIMTLIGVGFVMWYALRLEGDKTRSLVYKIDSERDINENDHENEVLTNSHRLVLLSFTVTIFLLIYGVTKWGWYIEEISGLFIGFGIAAAILGRLPVSSAVNAFIEGAKEMVLAALIIGLSKGLLVVASEGKIIDTILHYIATGAKQFSPVISAEIMFLFQSLLNFFIPSGSGQAALTMPIMAPLSDLLGVSRQTAVLAFQFGDGLSNLIIPTSGVTMGILSIAKIPYNIWLKWMLPLFLMLCLTAMLLLIPPLTLFSW